MAKKVSIHTEDVPAPRRRAPKSLAMFEGGVDNATDLCRASIAVCADLVADRMTPMVGNSVGAQLRNVLKAAELQLKYGQSATEGGAKTLRLS